MKYSIIIPTFNEEKTIRDAILQWIDFRDNIEIIISDGLSTDKTIDIAERMNVKIIQPNQPQKSIAEGRNLGTTVAANEWFIFLDSDVRFLNVHHFMKSIQSRIEKLDAATIRIKIYPDEEKFHDRIFHFLIYFSLRVLFWCGSAGGRGECQIIRKSVFEKIHGYNESLVGGEDYDLMRRVKKRGFQVEYLYDVIGYESPRHYRKSGYLKVLFLWFGNWVATFFGQSISRQWEKIR